MKYSPLLSSLSPLILAGYLFLAIVSLSHMSHMDMAGMTMADCPYLGLQSIPGNTLDAHLGTWQEYMQIVLPGLALLALMAPLLWVTVSAPRVPTSFRLPSTHRATIRSPLVLLFASGILHPKAP